MGRLTAFAYLFVYSLALPVIVLRLLRSPGSVMLRQRLALELPEPMQDCVWLHASSVGEVALLEPLVRAFERDEPDTALLITAFTSTGVAMARRRFSQHTVCALPFDYRFAVRRYIRRVRPRLTVIVESEFWPALLSVLHESGVPVAVLNGRISIRSMKAHARTRFVAQALRTVSAIAVQDDDNAERFRQLGFPEHRVHTTGNMKFDLVSPGDGAGIRAALGIAEDAKIVICGSLHEGESDMMLDAIFAPEPVTTSVVAVLAPRYTEAATEICESARRRGLQAILKTTLDRDPDRPRFDVCVLDTFGELRLLYAIADVVFVGGSLFDRGSTKGGHNLMEPAICGVPVLFGPYTRSFAQIARELESAAGGRTIRTVAELRAALRDICADPKTAARMGAAAREVVLAGQGATERNLTLIRGLLERSSH